MTGTALPGTLKALRKAGPQAVGLLPLSKEVPPALPPLTSELLAGAIGRLRGSVVGWGLGGPIGTARAALELTVLRGPRESSRRAHVVPRLRREERSLLL